MASAPIGLARPRRAAVARAFSKVVACATSALASTAKDLTIAAPVPNASNPAARPAWVPELPLGTTTREKVRPSSRLWLAISAAQAAYPRQPIGDEPPIDAT